MWPFASPVTVKSSESDLSEGGEVEAKALGSPHNDNDEELEVIIKDLDSGTTHSVKVKDVERLLPQPTTFDSVTMAGIDDDSSSSDVVTSYLQLVKDHASSSSPSVKKEVVNPFLDVGGITKQLTPTNPSSSPTSTSFAASSQHQGQIENPFIISPRDKKQSLITSGESISPSNSQQHHYGARESSSESPSLPPPPPPPPLAPPPSNPEPLITTTPLMALASAPVEDLTSSSQPNNLEDEVASLGIINMSQTQIAASLRLENQALKKEIQKMKDNYISDVENRTKKFQTLTASAMELLLVEAEEINRLKEDLRTCQADKELLSQQYANSLQEQEQRFAEELKSSVEGAVKYYMTKQVGEDDRGRSRSHSRGRSEEPKHKLKPTLFSPSSVDFPASTSSPPTISARPSSSSSSSSTSIISSSSRERSSLSRGGTSASTASSRAKLHASMKNLASSPTSIYNNASSSTRAREAALLAALDKVIKKCKNLEVELMTSFREQS
jgi:hypothetical protein